MTGSNRAGRETHGRNMKYLFKLLKWIWCDLITGNVGWVKSYPQSDREKEIDR